jgi:hypothetical protein
MTASPGASAGSLRSTRGATMNEHSIGRAINPLRLIFWGALICLFDLTFSQTTNGTGFKLDLLDDAVGTLMIAIGVFQLKTLSMADRYRILLTFVQVVSALAVLDAVRDHFVFPVSQAISFAHNLFGLATLAAIVAFCVAMRWFCEEASMFDPARSWRVTTVLFLVIYAVPLGLFYAATAVAVASETSFHFDLGPAGLLLLPVFVIPLVHLFISTSRMKRAAESVTGPEYAE